MAARGMLIPSFDSPVKGSTCEFCGMHFLDITPHEVFEGHVNRHIEDKVKEHRYHSSRGRILTCKGWKDADE